MILKWLRRRRLSEAGERRLLIALARAEEELVQTHVRNVQEVLDAVGDELPVRRAVELYLNEMQLEDPRSTIIAQRVLSRLEAGVEEGEDEDEEEEEEEVVEKVARQKDAGKKPRKR